MIKDYICLDIETTGLNPKTDKIIEFGAVKVRDNEVVDTLSFFVNPGRNLSEKVKELTGITDYDLQDKPFIDEVLTQIEEFIGEDILIGHNILFDFSFLKKAFTNQKKVFEKKGIDTLKLARKYLPEIESKRLDFLCQYYKIGHNSHRALGDALATSILYQTLCKEFEVIKLDPIALVYKVKRETPITKVQKEKLYFLMDKHKLVKEYEIDHMTKNEASRYIDQIMSTYGYLKVQPQDVSK